ncbi:RhoGAP-domain-containing protein [Melanomma pulvis-pyrius CBS 109.77]|uniref:RhoGAP-domain-containing protein n=1 Tax=Melanomma pulvis-pyrius CBS 109.77 TaxID=1314802 RepID=A0A6A6WRW5_9PLEO|nr:RhoGAP-domain-containing protein [Melanomma pulvis-pyrius CBS 109.77]
MAALPPSLPPMDSSDAFNPDFSPDLPAGTHANGQSGQPPPDAPTPAPLDAVAPANATLPLDERAQVHDVLHSDIGVVTLLSRLKASVASARDFAGFLKRRGATEEEHANSLKKLSRLTLENMRKTEARHESYQLQFEQVMHANERIADNGTQFGLALHAMHENLLQLATKMDASRKTWKQAGLAAETKVQEAEKLAEKAKAKYDQLAEDLDRVKTGDTGAGRKFGLKGPKSAAQHEEDLHRKVQAADQDYASKVQTAQSFRKELVATSRPQAVAAMVDLIREIDAALTMEMQKYASFNEKLVVNNGQVVSPHALQGGGTAQAPPSLNSLIYQINNEHDFDEYVLKQASRVPSVRSDLQYTKHPTLAQTQPQPASASWQPSGAASSARQVQANQPPAHSLAQSDAVNAHAHSQQQSQPSSLPEPVQLPSYQSYATGGHPPPQQQQAPPQQYHSQAQSQLPQFSGAPVYSPLAQNPYSQSPDYPRGPAGQATAQQSSGVTYNANPAPPVKPIFGVSLDDLFRRDGSPVPLVVYQCIQAVDLYGLEVEGIYRIPGTSSHIQAMKALFDSDASQVDFRNPEAFQQDVNSVAGLLKQFFRELPDPLLTKDFYSKFIEAARIDDDTMRRDSMHALINALPDPNYATLRAILLHLYRVQQASEVNRMSTANLGICWAPSIMGPHKGNVMADAGLQARVIITILDNVLQIFDED